MLIRVAQVAANVLLLDGSRMKSYNKLFHHSGMSEGGYTVEFTRKVSRIIKGAAICLMIWHHLFAFPERVTEGVFRSLLYFNDTNLSVCIGAFGRICVAVFTFLSGYGCYMASLRSDDVSALVRRHIFSLYKTFWMVFFCCLPVLIYKRRLLLSGIVPEVIYNMLGLRTSFNDEWWFVLPFAVLLILFPAIKRFIERPHAAFLSDMLIVVVLNAVWLYIIPSVAETEHFSALAETSFWKHACELMEILPAYVTGCLFARYGLLSEVKTRFGGQWLYCLAALLVMIGVFFIRPRNNKYYDFINAAVFISALTVFLPLKHTGLLKTVFEKLGEESAIMWLVHTFFCYYWFQRFTYLPKYSPLIFLWLLALSYGAAKLIRLIWKYIGALYKKLTGQTVKA